MVARTRNLIVVFPPEAGNGQDAGNILAVWQFQEVDQGLAPGRARAFRKLIDLGGEHPALGGKEQDIIVGVGGFEPLNHIFFFGRNANDPFAATPLGLIGVRWQALDIAGFGNDNHGLFFRDKVLGLEFANWLFDQLSPARVAVFVLEFYQLSLDDIADFLRALQQVFKLFD